MSRLTKKEEDRRKKVSNTEDGTVDQDEESIASLVTTHLLIHYTRIQLPFGWVVKVSATL